MLTGAQLHVGSKGHPGHSGCAGSTNLCRTAKYFCWKDIFFILPQPIQGNTNFWLAFQEAAGHEDPLALPCHQRHSRHQRQQCGLATANRVAALWNALASTEPSFQEHRMGRPVSGIGRAFQENHRREWARCSTSRTTAAGQAGLYARFMTSESPR